MYAMIVTEHVDQIGRGDLGGASPNAKANSGLDGINGQKQAREWFGKNTNCHGLFYYKGY